MKQYLSSLVGFTVDNYDISTNNHGCWLMFSRPKICTFAVAIHAILRYTFKMERNSQKSEESAKRKTSRFRTAALVVSGLLALIGYAGAVGLDSITIV
ncbi:MAG: hypothetical protein K2K22_02035, partial [Muribaculaceae bacterium]|nr:hypothetical protein [Muribaculaceae bacterium]